MGLLKLFPEKSPNRDINIFYFFQKIFVKDNEKNPSNTTSSFFDLVTSLVLTSSKQGQISEKVLIYCLLY